MADEMGTDSKAKRRSFPGDASIAKKGLSSSSGPSVGKQPPLEWSPQPRRAHSAKTLKVKRSSFSSLAPKKEKKTTQLIYVDWILKFRSRMKSA
jgi:hypothetical protein